MLLVICRVSALPVQVAGSQKELGASLGKGCLCVRIEREGEREEEGEREREGREGGGKERGEMK